MNISISRRIAGSLLVTLALLPTGLVLAQEFPSKPVKILVGFTPGGVPDITARLIAQKLNEKWKQAVTVENRPGAGSNIAAQAVAAAAPDGLTLLSVSSAHAIVPALYSKLPFDPLKDFSGITLTATGPALVIVSPKLPVKSMAEFIALAKSRPGQLNFSSAGTGSGSHFAVELLKSQAGLDIVHVPFKGIPEALNETIAGRVDLFISPFASAINLVRDGRARAIAVTSTQRVAELPDLPTVSESGVPDYKWIFWYGLLAPAKTPSRVIEQINADVGAALKTPEMTQRLRPLGTTALTSTPAEFDKLIADEVASFIRLSRAAGIPMN